MTTPLNMARLRTTRRTAFCWELTTWAVRTSSAVRPNFVRAPVAVTSATASPRRTSAPANVWTPGPASIGIDSPVSMDWSSRTSPPVSFTSAGTTPPSDSFTKSPGTTSATGTVFLPGAVAPDRRIQGKPRFQCGKRCLGPALLEQAERRVEHQESGNDRPLDIFAEHDLERDRGLEHPRHRRPEFTQRHAERMQRRIRHGVGAHFLQPA